jgi:hypothetical protein
LSESGALRTGGVWARHRKENVIESGIHLPNWKKYTLFAGYDETAKLNL